MPEPRTALGRFLLVRRLSLTALTALWPLSGPAGANPLGVDGSWQLVFSDEFDAPLSADKWTRCYWWDDKGCTNLGNKELQWYMPDNVIVSDGKLILRAKEQPLPGYKGQTYNYSSGMVTSGRGYFERPEPDRFATTYGYFEIRAKLPAGQGLWPAFWLLPSTHESKPEIDVMEVLGHEPDKLKMHVHYRDDNGDSQNAGSESTVQNMTEDFHVFGLEWRKDAIVWYFDGEEKWRYTVEANISQEPMYILLNLAVGGEWPGAPDQETVFPADYVIDYVKVWKRQS